MGMNGGRDTFKKYVVRYQKQGFKNKMGWAQNGQDASFPVRTLLQVHDVNKYSKK